MTGAASFAAADEDTMRAAIAAAWARGTCDVPSLSDVAACSIGCALGSLRDSEVQWIENEIGEHALGLR